MRLDAGVLALRLYTGLLLLFLSLPILVALGVAFGTDKIAHFPPNGLTIRWFGEAAANSTFMNSLGNSLKLALLTTFCAIALSLPCCLALVRRRFPFQNLLESFLLSPLSLPGIVFGVSLLVFMGVAGFGLAPWGLLVGHVVIAVPYVLKTVVAVYRGQDQAFEESAMVLGANPWRTFWYITLPLIRPGMVAGGLFAFLTSFDNVPVSIFLTTSSTTTLPVAVFSYLVNQDFDAIVGAISAIQIFLVLAILFVVDRFYGLSQMTSLGGQ
ncbi:MAG: ABC transporter permease [Chloroflexi bacterium]|nr:ABC transporter permease [Chloroflexota bacterium]